MLTNTIPSRAARALRSLVLSRAARTATAVASLAVVLAGATGCEDSGANATATPTGNVQPAATPPAAPPTVTATVTPAAQLRQPVPGGSAQIEFGSLLHDFGKISDTETHRTSFVFENSGNAVLTINDVKAACGCTVPTLAKRDYMPGESGQIDIVFDPKGKQGSTDKFITVVSNAQSGGVTKLKITSDIQPLLRFDRMHDLGILKYGEKHVSTVAIGYEDPDLEIRSLSFNNPDLSARVLDRTPNPEPGAASAYTLLIEITVSERANWGLIYATRLTIDAFGKPWPDSKPVPYTYDMFVTGKLYGDVVAAPAIVTLGQLQPGSVFEAQTVLSRPSGTPFRILEARVVECNMPGIVASGDPLGLNSNRLIISGNTGTFRGSVKGSIMVKTDVAGEEQLLIRFAGLVR